jgi:hypothetical protein
MERCPNCRARLDSGQQECRRCGMELALLWDLDAAVARLGQMAARALRDNDRQGAMALLEQRQQLRQDVFVGKLLAFLAASPSCILHHLAIREG